MLRNYFKIAFRNLSKNKSFSIINILGFAFSISICLMIILLVIKEKSFDSFPDAGQIYRLYDSENNTSAVDYRTAQIAMRNFPQIEGACVLNVNSETNILYDKNLFNIKGVMSADNNFFKVFSREFISGNAENPFADSTSCVLTESVAKKIFGKENPIGKGIIYNENVTLYVNGVVKDFQENSSIQANLFINSDKFKFQSFFPGGKDPSFYRYYYNVYLKLQKDADPVEIRNILNKRAEVFSPYIKKMGLLPLKDIYLYDATSDGYTAKGNPGLLNLMTNIAAIILILSIINYVNLTAAQQNKRNKETGIRKTVGASRKDMIYLFLSESLLVAFISFGIAAALLEVFLPLFSSIIEKNLNSAALYRYPTIVMVSAAIFIIGLIAGIGPAIAFSSFNPVRMLSGGVISRNKKSALRNFLTVFQFAVSICLIFCLIVIQKQMDYVKQKDLGFDKEQTMTFNAPFDNSKKYEIKDKLLKNPNVLSVTITEGTPGEIVMYMGSGIEGKNELISCINVDTSFLKTFSIPIIKGRDFLPGDVGKACIFNEAAYKYFEFADLENARLNNGRGDGYKEVIGVVKDFNFSSLHEKVAPMALLLDDWMPSTFSIKIAKGQAGPVMEYLKKIWNETNSIYPLQYEFFDERFDSMYKKEEKFGELIGLFSMLAIVISCMGILGLAVFSSERRAKEIGIRKVHGASIPNLMIMLNSDFVKWVAIAFIIAAPMGYYIMSKWLEDFAFKTEIDWTVFFLSGFFALSVALFTINWQIWRTTTRNPVEVLKYE